MEDDFLEKILYRIAWNTGLTTIEDLLLNNVPKKHLLTDEEKAKIAYIFDNKLITDKDLQF